MNLSKFVGHSASLLGLLAGVIFLAGCHTQSSDQQFSELQGVTVGSTGGAAPESPGGNGTHVLKAGDLLNVVYSDTPVVLPGFEGRIKENGAITLVFNQAFTAAGKTRGELEKEIHDRYVPKYFKYMTVTVRVQEGTRFYYVGGEVKSPGQHAYIARITLTQAIQSSGDFTDFANKKKVKLIHADGRSQIINCIKVLRNPSLDPEVFPNDKIHVPRKLF